MIRYRNDTKLHKILSLLGSEVPITPRIKLSKKNVGLKVKDNLEKVLQSFAKVDIYDLLRTLESSGKYLLTYSEGLLLELRPDDVELSYESAEGYALAENEDTLVFIDAKRDRDLVTKGLMRDLARNLQQLRKERGYNTTDIIPSANIAGLEEEEILRHDHPEGIWRPRLRLQMEHGLDARHAQLHREGPDLPGLPPQPDDVLADVRVQRELRAADQPRRGRARQGLAAGQDAR